MRGVLLPAIAPPALVSGRRRVPEGYSLCWWKTTLLLCTIAGDFHRCARLPAPVHYSPEIDIRRSPPEPTTRHSVMTTRTAWSGPDRRAHLPVAICSRRVASVVPTTRRRSPTILWIGLPVVRWAAILMAIGPSSRGHQYRKRADLYGQV